MMNSLDEKFRTRQTYNRLSRFYDLLAGSSEQRLIRAGLDALDIQPGETVLEPGCGTGYGLSLIAERIGDKGQVHGIDISEGMLDKAARRLDKIGFSSRVRLFHSDVVNASLVPNYFDAVFASFFIELLSPEDGNRILAVLRQSLKPTGRICVVGMSNQVKSNPMMKLYQAANKHFPHWVDCRPKDVSTTLVKAGFQIKHTMIKNLFGLGVEIVLAVPD